MPPRKIIDTTLGDIIVAMIDEITPYLRDPKTIYRVVECILSDLIAERRLRFRARSPQGSRMYH